ncbi:hypothetical protein Btru_068077 [Bulinus truncatus]|nr:hypothetical protein Btru_068077 [Bulinus truncatus]
MSKDSITRNGFKSNLNFVRSMTLTPSNSIPNHGPDSPSPSHPGSDVRQTPPPITKQHSDVPFHFPPSLILDIPETGAASAQGCTQASTPEVPPVLPVETSDLSENCITANNRTKLDVQKTYLNSNPNPAFDKFVYTGLKSKRHSIGSLGSELMGHDAVTVDLLPNNTKLSSDPSFDQSALTLQAVNSILSSVDRRGGGAQADYGQINSPYGQASGTDSSRSSRDSLTSSNNHDKTGTHAEQTSRFLIPPCIFNVPKTRSESALSSLTTPNVIDPRVNSSFNNLAPPTDLISSHPRRDSAWTAEVLSIEIQVDYVMDPAELWGSGVIQKTPKKVIINRYYYYSSSPLMVYRNYFESGHIFEFVCLFVKELLRVWSHLEFVCLFVKELLRIWSHL